MPDLTNINLDLIYRLSKTNLSGVGIRSLDTAITYSLSPEHVSLYALEPGRRHGTLFNWVQQGDTNRVAQT